MEVTALETEVKAENQIVQNRNSLVAWGAREIGQIIGRTQRQTHHLLERGLIKSARKTGGRWNAGTSDLRREFGIR